MMKGVEKVLNVQYLTLDNFLLNDKSMSDFGSFSDIEISDIDFQKMLQIFVLSPIREEMIVRGTVFLLLYRHASSSQQSIKDQKKQSQTKQVEHEQSKNKSKNKNKQKNKNKNKNNKNKTNDNELIQRNKKQTKKNDNTNISNSGSDSDSNNDSDISEKKEKEKTNEKEKENEIMDDEYISRVYNASNLYLIRMICILSASMFGLMHFMNFFSTRYSREYALMQMIMGTVLSLFYILRLVITESLWEPILLHSINNIFSSFIRFDTDDIFETPVLFSCMCMELF